MYTPRYGDILIASLIKSRHSYESILIVSGSNHTYVPLKNVTVVHGVVQEDDSRDAYALVVGTRKVFVPTSWVESTQVVGNIYAKRMLPTHISSEPKFRFRLCEQQATVKGMIQRRCDTDDLTMINALEHMFGIISRSFAASDDIHPVAYLAEVITQYGVYIKHLNVRRSYRPSSALATLGENLSCKICKSLDDVSTVVLNMLALVSPEAIDHAGLDPSASPVPSIPSESLIAVLEVGPKALTTTQRRCSSPPRGRERVE